MCYENQKRISIFSLALFLFFLLTPDEMLTKKKIETFWGNHLLNKEELHSQAEEIVDKAPLPAGYFLEILSFFKWGYEPHSWHYVSRLSDAIEKFEYLCQKLMESSKSNSGAVEFFYALCSCAVIYPDIARSKIFEELLEHFS